ncbi:MAG: ribonuclease III [Patescibacteria group bacterium]|nr:ribonuclease III [Patescibacteria group bacterium]
MRNFAKLEKKIDYRFKNKELLKQALVHRSYLNENPDFPLPHNERLEFLGDAVIELVVTVFLFKNYPNPEGDLTNFRASLVNTKMLAQRARELDLEKYLYLSKGEAKDKNQKARQSILANTFESMVGAIYLDQGFKKANKFITENLLQEFPNILKERLYIDAKSRLQEIVQDKVGVTPEYKVLKEWGPDHSRKFNIGVFFGKELVAEGVGSSKQEGQMKAAEKALIKKGWQ